MRFSITGRHVVLTPSLGVYAREKLAKLFGKLFRNHPELLQSTTVDIQISRVTAHHRKGNVWKADAAVAVAGRKNPLYAEVTDEDVRAAIDLLSEELEQELKKYKGKAQALAKRGARAAKRILRYDPAARIPQKGGRVRDEGQ